MSAISYLLNLATEFSHFIKDSKKNSSSSSSTIASTTPTAEKGDADHLDQHHYLTLWLRCPFFDQHIEEWVATLPFLLEEEETKSSIQYGLSSCRKRGDSSLFGPSSSSSVYFLIWYHWYLGEKLLSSGLLRRGKN